MEADDEEAKNPVRVPGPWGTSDPSDADLAAHHGLVPQSYIAAVRHALFQHLLVFCAPVLFDCRGVHG